MTYQRNYDDWLTAFLDYAKFGEAPKRMYFWAGVSALAGALRRKVWIDMEYFKWYCNMYICFVAPPGIVSKSTTAGIAMNLLRQVPGMKFGPDVVTWPALVTAFAESTEAFEYQGEYHPMSAMTLEASEFGNLLNPQDKEMVDLLVSLWDGKQGTFDKKTKHSGSDSVENPWINLIACTTPAWIAGNFPEYMIGGGFTSRTIFVYADKKAQFVAYPSELVPEGLGETQKKLVEDLTHISTSITGPFVLDKEAVEWGMNWYRDHYTVRASNLDPERFGGYLARKQTHMHKLAMILSASSGEDRIIRRSHLEDAYVMLTDLEPDMQFVFSKIGRSDVSLHIERLVNYVHGKQRVVFSEAYGYVHTSFPSMREFEDALAGCVRAGYIKLQQSGADVYLVAGRPLPSAQNGIALEA